jgi:hypothetical protein
VTRLAPVRKPRSWRTAAAHRVVRALLIALAAPGAVLAHHSISGVYDSSRQVMVEGYVVEFQFVNPHPVIVVAASDGAAAESSTWRLEMDNRYELVDVGVTATTFNRGDRVIATGSAARDESHSLYLMKLDRPADGLRYEQIGFSPRISTTR